jgi:hypothetical protein
MEQEKFEDTKAFEVFKKAYLKVPVGKPSIHIPLKVRLQPYQKQIIELIKKDGETTLRFHPREYPKLKLHKKSLLEELYTSTVLNDEIREKIEAANGKMFTTGVSLIEFNPHRPTMIFIDDPIAPQRSETK